MNGIKLSTIESDRRYARYVRERNKILFGENKKNIKDKIVDIVLVGMLVWSFILLTVFTILLLAQLFK
ncbi:hypothetical protein [Solobacterium sp.]|uniref:Uncharacterized protein n=1 Tax=Podoviridae sp. ctiVc2 TaxID=2827745 RepID=A0A8S5SAQ3_9CAUD|nr:hypothetical protein [Solobacterium sp.]MBF1086506.1 hypothetical protein [Solobacterium sp.]DAF47778.1 MAG TPA: hypothetical protein [Podoviridae sp. ctiVc2]